MKLFSILLFIFFSGKLFSQNQTASSGGTATGTGGTATYTVGLPLYTNQSNTSLTILQGNQQPKEFLTISYKQPEFSGIRVFPNPAQSQFLIQLGAFNFSNLHYKLITTEGKIVYEDNFSQKLTSVDISNLAVGVYYLQILNLNELLSFSKIIKINF
ncbi:MAG: T9SS type A sorting domain-containing protein [Bacteroidia bacterium]|nr:T9SS type A sorting domain-containing protein [Bacteroidia bacterium]